MRRQKKHSSGWRSASEPPVGCNVAFFSGLAGTLQLWLLTMQCRQLQALLLVAKIARAAEHGGGQNEKQTRVHVWLWRSSGSGMLPRQRKRRRAGG